MPSQKKNIISSLNPIPETNNLYKKVYKKLISFIINANSAANQPGVTGEISFCKCLIKAITCIQHGRKVQFQKTSEV